MIVDHKSIISRLSAVSRTALEAALGHCMNARHYEATVEHVKKTDPDIFFTTVAYPIKGTPYFSEVAARVDNPKAWSEGSDRNFRIRNRHSRQYYKHADKLLRSAVELKHLEQSLNPDAATIAALQSGISDARLGLQTTAAEVEA